MIELVKCFRVSAGVHASASIQPRTELDEIADLPTYARRAYDGEPAFREAEGGLFGAGARWRLTRAAVEAMGAATAHAASSGAYGEE